MQMCMKSQVVSPLESELMNQGFCIPLSCQDIAVKGMSSLYFCSESILSFGSLDSLSVLHVTCFPLLFKYIWCSGKCDLTVTRGKRESWKNSLKAKHVSSN